MQLELNTAPKQEHNYTRICKELRKIGKIERERMRKGVSYTTWADRGADAVEYLLVTRNYAIGDSNALSQAKMMIKNLDQERYHWKSSFMILLVASICTVLVLLSLI